MSSPLSRALNHYEYLQLRLQEEFPDTEEECLLDTLEGMTNLHEMLSELLRSRLDDLAFAKALRSRVSDMQERLSRFETRADKKKQLAISVMDRAGINKLEEADFTASLRAVAPSLLVTGEDQIPDVYWNPQPAKLDRQALLRDLKLSTEVPGASLDNGSLTLAVRTK